MTGPGEDPGSPPGEDTESSPGVSPDKAKHSAWELFREGPYRLLFVMRLSSNMASQMMNVIVSWQIYEITGSALQLGMIGLIQFMPPLLLTLTAGHVSTMSELSTSVL